MLLNNDIINVRNLWARKESRLNIFKIESDLLQHHGTFFFGRKDNETTSTSKARAKIARTKPKTKEFLCDTKSI